MSGLRPVPVSRPSAWQENEYAVPNFMIYGYKKPGRAPMVAKLCFREDSRLSWRARVYGIMKSVLSALRTGCAESDGNKIT